MIEKQMLKKRTDIKTSITNSQNVLMSDNDLNKIDGKKVYESIKEKNKVAKKRIIMMNDKEDINSANSKRSNENILLLNKNKTNIKFGRNKNIYNDDYINKFDAYFTSKNNLNTNKLSTEEINEINNDETLNDDEISSKVEENIEKEKNNINEIFNIITGYDLYKKIEISFIKLFFFSEIPEGKTLNTNINKIKKNINNDIVFNYNLEIIRNNQIYFYAQITKTFPSINIKIFIKTPDQQYIKVGKIISNVLKNNFILYEGDNKTNYKKVLNINYDLNFFGFKVRNMIVEKIVNEKIKYILCNDSPEWDYEYKTYKLNFNGRVKKSCKKNFILKYKNSINKENNENIKNERLLQCGKIDDNCFALDFISPLSPFEAFSISITSIIYKISCE